jgi:hypothetical protein
MAEPDLLPRDVRLLREEDVSLFDFGHNIYFGHSAGVLLDFAMPEAFAADRLTHLDEVGGGALEADDCVSWPHVMLKPLELVAASHD